MSYTIHSNFVWLVLYLTFFFSFWVFFHQHPGFTRQQGKAEAISLTPNYFYNFLYHIHPLHKHLDIILAITADRSTLHIVQQPNSNWVSLDSDRNALTTELRALNTVNVFINSMVWFLKLKLTTLSRVDTCGKTQGKKDVVIFEWWINIWIKKILQTGESWKKFQKLLQAGIVY